MGVPEHFYADNVTFVVHVEEDVNVFQVNGAYRADLPFVADDLNGCSVYHLVVKPFHLLPLPGPVHRRFTLLPPGGEVLAVTPSGAAVLMPALAAWVTQHYVSYRSDMGISGAWTGHPAVIHQPSGGHGADLPWRLSRTAQVQPWSRASSLPGFGVSVMMLIGRCLCCVSPTGRGGGGVFPHGPVLRVPIW